MYRIQRFPAIPESFKRLSNWSQQQSFYNLLGVPEETWFLILHYLALNSPYSSIFARSFKF